MKVNMNIMKKSMTGAFLALAAVSTGNIEPMEACTRAVYIGPEQMVITGRTMDWKEDIMSNIYVFPRGMKRAGYNKGETVNWTSKYGSVIATGYDIGTCDGINEKGLVASLLFLPESVYSLPGDTRPVMGISIWTQYVLDNFATVHEAVEELKKETFRIDAPRMPNNGPESTLHLAITDETGNTAILEYLDGKLNIHEGKEYRVMTNSPRYEEQLAINRYWEEIGGLVMLPGTNRASDRFVRASFYIKNPPNVRCQNRSTQCIECHAQCIGSLRYKYTRQTAHLLYPLEVNLRSKEQSILLRIDTHPQSILARLEKNRFQSVGKSEKTPAIERRNLCRRCYKRFTRQQTFRFSVSNPGDVIHRAFHIIDMKHSIINCTNTLRQTSEIYGTNQTLNTTLHLSEEKFFVLLPENL